MGHHNLNYLPLTSKTRAFLKAYSIKDKMDVLKLLVEISLQVPPVAGEKTDLKFDGNLKELPKSNADSKKSTSYQYDQRQKKPWKWRKKSTCSKFKKKSTTIVPEIDTETSSNNTSKIQETCDPTRVDEVTKVEYKSSGTDISNSSNVNNDKCTSLHNGFPGDIPSPSEPVTQDSSAPDTSSEAANDCSNMSMLQKLALNALNLTAPASSVLLNNRRNSWVQLSGHPGCLAPAGPGTIWKKRSGDTNESLAYKGLMKDIAREIVPTFYREVVFEGEYFIEIRDLLYEFNNPSVMDIKIGTRTFLESEVSNKKARNDLYRKMVKLDPKALTDEENSEEAVTKLRYMDFRDNMSSSRSLGFRVEALKMSGTKGVTEVRTVRTREDAINSIGKFLGSREHIKKQILSRLKEIKNVFENSPFLQKHEVIGSSILFIYDDEKAGAWAIDFAKTLPLPEGFNTDHKSPWVLGNHEEGYSTGIENLIQVVSEVPVMKTRRLPFFSR